MRTPSSWARPPLDQHAHAAEARHGAAGPRRSGLAERDARGGRPLDRQLGDRQAAADRQQPDRGQDAGVQRSRRRAGPRRIEPAVDGDALQRRLVDLERQAGPSAEGDLQVAQVDGAAPTDHDADVPRGDPEAADARPARRDAQRGPRVGAQRRPPIAFQRHAGRHGEGARVRAADPDDVAGAGCPERVAQRVLRAHPNLAARGVAASRGRVEQLGAGRRGSVLRVADLGAGAGHVARRDEPTPQRARRLPCAPNACHRAPSLRAQAS